MTTAAPTRRAARPHAWLFAVTATIGLIPGTYGLGMAAMTVFLLPPVLAMWSVGLALLIGYWMYLLRAPMPDGPGVLWRGSAIYNGALAFAWLTAGFGGTARAVEVGSWDTVGAFGASVVWLLFLSAVSAHAAAVDAPAGGGLASSRALGGRA